MAGPDTESLAIWGPMYYIVPLYIQKYYYIPQDMNTLTFLFGQLFVSEVSSWNFRVQKNPQTCVAAVAMHVVSYAKLGLVINAIYELGRLAKPFLLCI